jgi:hypothetical protein
VLYDVFVAHASEDKDAFVRPLAERLREAHIEVWYDEFSLKVGDSLRRSIDRGLAQARFGIVVLSPHFFAKQWSQWELDGLVARQNSAAGGVILPVWHNVTQSDVVAYSPPLADKVATLSSEGLDEVVAKLGKVIRPQGSSLIEAREYLIEKGWESPPVISDDWWLDMAGAAESNSDGSAVGWGRWGFPLPPWDDEARARGRRIGQAALQESWKFAAEDQRISQVTPPEQVHDFIRLHPGLLETCLEHATYVIEYAPQLVIPGFGGPLEEEIKRIYQIAAAYRADRVEPEQFALRAPDFYNMDPALVACHYVQGGIMGPSTSFYEQIDIAVWLLSAASRWLPGRTRGFLTQGMIEWAVWPWQGHQWRYQDEFGFVDSEDTGALSARLYHARSADTVRITRKIRADMEHRFDFTAQLLDLPETGVELADRFLEAKFIEGWFEDREERRARRRTAREAEKFAADLKGGTEH